MSIVYNGNGNSNGHQNLEVLRVQPMYSYTEAAHLARVSTSTVRNWLLGYAGTGRDVPPLFTTHERERAMVSFLNLIEIVVAAQFRKSAHVKYQMVRHAYEDAKKIFELDYPFAHLKLEAIGGYIVHNYLGQVSGASMQSMSEPLQWTLGLPLPDEVLQTINQLDYIFDLAARWFPAGKEVPIVLDPLMSSGTPTILGSHVTISAIHQRFKAGYKIDFLAKDYELDRDVVETAIQYADLVAA